MIARAWGCTPADLRHCTIAEVRAMAAILADEYERVKEAGR